MGETNIAATNALSDAASLTAAPSAWESYGTTLIWVVVIGALFIYLWRKGHIARLREYINGTREELRKCSWPSKEELKGSTVLVIIAIALLGGYTVAVDFVLAILVRYLT